MNRTFLHYGIEAAAGRFVCADCGKAIRLAAQTTLPPCPDFNPNTHKRKGWLAPEEPKSKNRITNSIASPSK